MLKLNVDFFFKYVTCLYGALNLLQRKIPNASVKIATVEQKAHVARLCFNESKSIVTVQRCFNLEYRNCQSQDLRAGTVPHRKRVGRPSVSDEVVERERETFTP
ncbi:hypothetical protein AVEN_201967-1 [Araneus ventricosus]|uniref:DUF4817 domain-containing protein n=1 Tax=Araneus ventricosus TaxID=182803 RepID=A0A4Y2RGV5_ARAVE|nr:hypothetical protein AVEN_79549-1 [Araneus ventricosus]GBN74476.1 hypothetical protein AVEN_93708-1 [Araneus ventricosus]GBN74477.1 hypothetical protein AVEN_130243-1 [Araneus ventricosus]GBN74487.1 hypothetical protein AVEN_201967-1 [Araneus ventricosus]